MASKFDIVSGHAPGYWGGKNIRCRINSEFVSDKVISQNYDKLYAMGLPFAVWREAQKAVSNPLQCTCFKDTAKQPDIPCAQCYGTGFIPGYIKFGTQNYWKEASDANWTLTNLVLDKQNRPFRLMLGSAATTGTAVSPDITLSTASKLGAWEYKVDGFTRDAGVASTITAEFSVNSGSTWNLISALDSVNPTTKIRFRITLTRTTTTVKSPMFEIVRVRFPVMGDIRDELDEPVIRAIPTWDQEQEIRQTFGSRIDNDSKSFWTLPLTFFDSTLAKETLNARLIDDVFVEVRYGGEIGFRYALNQFKYSDTFGVFTRQEFAIRRIAGSPGTGLNGEVYMRVF